MGRHAKHPTHLGICLTIASVIQCATWMPNYCTLDTYDRYISLYHYPGFPHQMISNLVWMSQSGTVCCPGGSVGCAAITHHKYTQLLLERQAISSNVFHGLFKPAIPSLGHHLGTGRIVQQCTLLQYSMTRHHWSCMHIYYYVGNRVFGPPHAVW